MKCRKCGKRKAQGKDCKFCHRERAAKAVRHPEGCLRHRFRDLMNRTRTRHWPPPDFTLDQFVDHFRNNPEFLRVWKAWDAKKYHKNYAPSVDRVDPRLPYLLENIRIVTWAENHAKGYTGDRELGTVDPSQWSGNSQEIPQEYTPAPEEEIPDYW